jgi:tetratricopeptide (TPR) repeat protein
MPLELEFELVSVLRPGEFEPQLWEMTTRDKWESVPIIKTQGAQFVALQKFDQAVERYTRALALLEAILNSTDLLRFERKAVSQGGGKGLWDLDDDERRGEAWNIDPAEVKATARACRLNYALCKLKLGDYKPAIEQCSLVLNEDPTNVKALFRRAQAHIRMGRDLEAAEADLKSLVTIEAQGDESAASPEIKRELAELEKRWKTAKETEKKMFKGIFER